MFHYHTLHSLYMFSASFLDKIEKNLSQEKLSASNTAKKQIVYSNSPCKNTHISESKQAFFIFLAIFFQLKNVISFIISLFSNFYYVYNYSWDVSFLSTKRCIIMQFFLFYFEKKLHPKTILSGKTEKTQQNTIKIYEAPKFAKSSKRQVSK